MICKGLIKIIYLYQKFFSPDHSFLSHFFLTKRCRFYPSCSEYAVQALSQYGLAKGIMVSFRRIVRCNPFCVGGYDPIKKNKKDAAVSFL